MVWVSWPLYIFVFLASFSSLWWPNIWPKMGDPELFEKTIGSIHFIPDIYPYGVNLLTSIRFCVPSFIFGPLVAKYLAENGVSGTFWKNSLHWCHNDHDGISNHQPHGCLLNHSFRCRSKKTSKLRFTGLCAGNSPGPVNSPHKGPVTRKMFTFDDVIMYWLNSFFFLKNSHLCNAGLQNRNLYWIFLVEKGSDQSGGILSPFMGTACFFLVPSSCFL